MMNAQAQAILSQMVDQFQARHQRLPEKIVVVPLACLALAAKRSLAPLWQGIRVECREIKETEATKDRKLVKSLGIFILPEDHSGRLVACDLRT